MSLDDYSGSLAAMSDDELYRHAVGRAAVELRRRHPYTSADWGRLADEFTGRLQTHRLERAMDAAKQERTETERGNDEALRRLKGGG